VANYPGFICAFTWRKRNTALKRKRSPGRLAWMPEKMPHAPDGGRQKVTATQLLSLQNYVDTTRTLVKGRTAAPSGRRRAGDVELTQLKNLYD
jgi:hypothetical protein